MEEKTPLMLQYDGIKKGYQDTLLFFQVGDFYELFYDDAITVSRALGITLTSRGKSKEGLSIPLCGVPVHTVEFHIKKLLDQGFKIALCDQIGEAQPKGVIQRTVVRVFTPGTLIDTPLLQEKKPSYLLSVAEINESLGFVVTELLMGTIQCTLFQQTDSKIFEAELARFSPDEIVISDMLLEKFLFLKEQNFFVSPYVCTTTNMLEWLEKRKIVLPDRCKELPVYSALEQLYSYLQYTNPQSLSQSYTISYYVPDEYLAVDATTQVNLGLFSSSREKKQSLFDVLDSCVTPMGSRMLKKFLLSPLKLQHAIERRLRIVDYFFQNYSILLSLRNLLSKIGDFERIIGRIALNRASLLDYQSLKHILIHIRPFFDFITPICRQESIVSTARLLQCYDLYKLYEFLDQALHNESTTEYFIRHGYNKVLDELRNYANDTRKNIIELEREEQRLTGISSLKIRHNHIHGYSIEVTQANVHKIPKTYKRLQSLTGKERYINDALQELGKKIEYANQNLLLLEQEIFEQVKTETLSYLPLLRQLSFLFSYFDVVTTHAYNAHQYSYVMPQINNDGIISITSGRHPIIERLVSHQFVSNSVHLNNEQFLIVLTGPNMGGKSTYLRQSALICLMAHIGSFVPAKNANIMVLDRIFTRIGAGDNLAEGKSTFLVEMEEVATICKYASSKSLVILDEVGRGTGTREGVAIAQAILEYLCATTKPRCLFATHYQELAKLEQIFDAITAYCVESRNEKESLVFLYTVIRGIAPSSFGVEVAKIAQLPAEIIQRARAILETDTMYYQDNNQSSCEKVFQFKNKNKTLTSRYEFLDEINLDTITPKQALDLLFRLNNQEL